MNQSQLSAYVSQHLPAELRLMQTGGYAAACPELVPAEKAVIYHYTHVGSSEANRALHDSNGSTDTPFGQALATALAKLPPFKGQQLFSAAWLTQPRWQQLLVAAADTAMPDLAPLPWPAFLSASQALLVAEQHLNYSPKSCLLSIRSKTGRLVESLSHYGPNGPDPAQNEREVIFLPNTQFSVISLNLATPWPEIGLVEL
jgi:hypothetical protein